METKKIGIIMSSYNTDPLFSLYKGITEAASKLGYITQSYMIYLSYQATDKFNAGEVRIFEMVDFSQFDGLVVALNTIASEKTQIYLKHILSQLDIPIITIDCSLPNSVTISTDNYRGTRDLLQHLVDKHGCRKINYISGPTDNEESILRLNAYLDGMKENGLSTEGRVYTGTFYVEDGEKAYQFFKNNPLSMDYDAVMCGNDIAAYSLLCTFKNRGINVPEQVKVTGFDNLPDSNQRSFDLTTIYKNDYSVGTFSVALLTKMFAGEAVEKEHAFPSTLVFRNSCGCHEDENLRDVRQDRFYERYEIDHLLKVYIKTMIEKGLACETFGEFIGVLNELIEKVKPPFFNMRIHSEYDELFQLDRFETTPYSDHSECDTGMVSVITRGDADGCHEYITSPLHFGEKVIGFITWGDSDFPISTDLYWEFVTNINLNLYALHNKLQLNELYRKDYMTNLYNRFGLRFYWDDFVQRGKETKRDITVIFADVNDLKKINDKLGHEYGDLAIKSVAKILLSARSKAMKTIRYGGDELLMICPDSTEEEIQSLIETIRKQLYDYGCLGDSDLRLSASLGYYIRPYDSTLSMDECIKMADDAMYEEKMAYHKKTSN